MVSKCAFVARRKTIRAVREVVTATTMWFNAHQAERTYERHETIVCPKEKSHRFKITRLQMPVSVTVAWLAARPF